MDEQVKVKGHLAKESLQVICVHSLVVTFILLQLTYTHTHTHQHANTTDQHKMCGGKCQCLNLMSR